MPRPTNSARKCAVKRVDDDELHVQTLLNHVFDLLREEHLVVAVVGARHFDVIEDGLWVESFRFGEADDPVRSERVLGVDIDDDCVGVGCLDVHCEGVRYLGFARAVLAEALRDAPGLEATAHNRVKTLDAG